jgi:putative two-component system response regulator
MTDSTSVGPATVLVIDDTPENLALMSGLLKGHYRVKVANSGARGLRIAATEPVPDLILLDIMMPEMDGYEVCRLLKATPVTRDIPVIFLTARSDASDEQHGLEMGAVDYITKPISPAIVMARVRNHLTLKTAADVLRDQNAFLENEIRARTRQLEAIQDVTIQVVTSLAETRDQETGNHIRRTQLYVEALAQRLRDNGHYTSVLTDEYIRVLFKSAPLHDIGKVGIPDNILLKPGKLTPEEFEIMKTHARLGSDAIERAEKALGLQADFLTTAKEIAVGHHEKWDGSGYPLGLREDQIPLSARLMALADVYDALISRRVYKEGMPHEEAVSILFKGRGSHFDPLVFDTFMELQECFREIARTHADSDQDLEAKRASLNRLARD